jgi:hypothetical protein
VAYAWHITLGLLRCSCICTHCCCCCVQGLMSATQYVEQSTHAALVAACERFPDYPLLITGRSGRQTGNDCSACQWRCDAAIQRLACCMLMVCSDTTHCQFLFVGLLDWLLAIPCAASWWTMQTCNLCQYLLCCGVQCAVTTCNCTTPDHVGVQATHWEQVWLPS